MEVGAGVDVAMGVDVEVGVLAGDDGVGDAVGEAVSVLVKAIVGCSVAVGKGVRVGTFTATVDTGGGVVWQAANTMIAAAHISPRFMIFPPK